MNQDYYCLKKKKKISSEVYGAKFILDTNENLRTKSILIVLSTVASLKFLDLSIGVPVLSVMNLLMDVVNEPFHCMEGFCCCFRMAVKVSPVIFVSFDFYTN